MWIWHSRLCGYGIRVRTPEVTPGSGDRIFKGHFTLKGMISHLIFHHSHPVLAYELKHVGQNQKKISFSCN